MKTMTTEQFLTDIANHKLTIRLDNGVYRHLFFRQPKDSWNMWFELVTWPGSLTINGDMGSWAFSRIEDMFGFFRSTSGLKINPDYWAEKICGGVHGGSDSAKTYDADLFREQLLESLGNYDLDESDLRDVTRALKDEVLCHDNKYELMIAARDFSHKYSSEAEPFQFDPCELPDGKQYAYHFIWCLYAIVWGIQQYDAAKGQSSGASA